MRWTLPARIYTTKSLALRAQKRVGRHPDWPQGQRLPWGLGQ